MPEFKQFNRRDSLLIMGAASLAACTAPSTSGEELEMESNETPKGWRNGAAMPFAVQEIYPSLHNGRIHQAGGLIAFAGTIVGAATQHISWAPGETEWRTEPDLPLTLHHPQMISFQGALMALGGFHRANNQTWIMQTGCWQLDGETWIPAPGLPQPNGESVSVVLGDGLHICGGRVPKGEANAEWQDHTDTDAHFVLADRNGTWETAAPFPNARNSAAAAVIDGAWHVVGGRTVAGGNTPAHDVYDAREDRWRSAAPMPQGQGGLAAATVGGKLYAFGGEWFGGDGGGVYKECWVYDPASDAWAAISDMPNPRHGLGAVAIDGDIYVIGGALQPSGNQTSTLVEVYRP